MDTTLPIITQTIGQRYVALKMCIRDRDSIEVILNACCGAIAEGLEERKAEKADEKAAAEQAEEVAEAKPRRTRKARKEEAPAAEAAATEAPAAE